MHDIENEISILRDEHIEIEEKIRSYETHREMINQEQRKIEAQLYDLNIQTN